MTRKRGRPFWDGLPMLVYLTTHLWRLTLRAQSGKLGCGMQRIRGSSPFSSTHHCNTRGLPPRLLPFISGAGAAGSGLVASVHDPQHRNPADTRG